MVPRPRKLLAGALAHPAATVSVHAAVAVLQHAPWQGLVWAWQWGAGWLRLWCLLGVLGTLLVCLLGWWASGKLAQANPPAMTGHGTGRWATKKDMKTARLL